MSARPRVLIVDDYPPNRVAADIVLGKDYDVAHAGSGAEALRLCESEDFTVILLDARMPVLSGYQTAAELRRRERTRHTPIVLTSAVDRSSDDILQGFAAGATDFLFSPWDAEYLRVKVATYVKMQLSTLALKAQVARLSDILRDLRQEIALKADPASILFAQVQSLERTIRELGLQAGGG